MFLIRQAGPADFPGVFALAKLLDSYNLPADRGYIRELLEASQASFAGRSPRVAGRYLFVLEEGRRIVGCSLIIAKHGRRGKPHLWLSLEKVAKRSRTLGLARAHQVLRLGYTEDGPTEVGGLVVMPGYRRHPEACGLQISFVRFLYMGIHPDRFERRILVEYRGAMGAGNRSIFWEAMGRIFTGLPYSKADRLSVTNKEFILSLFPREPIYCALLPEPVQRAIGAIHPAAQRAADLLRSIGFRPLPQIEPFDGGPYFSAERGRIRLIRRIRRLTVAAASSAASSSYLVGTEAGGLFRAARIPGKLRGGRLTVSGEALRLLRISEGASVYACPV
ncbi:MAG: arginine N-succinyltransferase [Candidatus Omnitrophica bacterium]|nr:arginine N-succinyltransferase [Candidatus Omnitrophota bacterium]